MRFILHLSPFFEIFDLHAALQGAAALYRNKALCIIIRYICANVNRYDEKKAVICKNMKE